MGLGKPYAVLLNPKTLDLVEARWERRRPLDNSEFLIYNYTLGPPRSQIGMGAIDGYVDNDWPRSHSELWEGWLGRGFGAALYCSLALRARERHGLGVYSDPGDRTDDADHIWERLVQHGLAYRDRGLDFLPADRVLKSGLVVSASSMHTKPPPEVVVNVRVHERGQKGAIESFLAQQYSQDVAAQFAATARDVAGLGGLPAKARRWLKRYEALDF